MKIYAVVANVDFGYEVQKCFFHLKDAKEEAHYLNKQKYEMYVKQDLEHLPESPEFPKTEDAARERVNKWHNWNYYTVEEFEVV